MAGGMSDASSQLSQLRSVSPNILFIIARSKNANIVVYEAKMVGAVSGSGGASSSSSGGRAAEPQLDSSEPVIVYWLDIDPAYQKENRRKGVMSDRSELGSVEKRFAYGLSSQPMPGKTGSYAVKLVAFPDRVVVVRYDATLHRPVAFMQINGRQCQLERIYVSATDNFIGLPTVHYVDVTGIDDSGQHVTERITKQ
jgi:Domain of unknown function (DUF4833)